MIVILAACGSEGPEGPKGDDGPRGEDGEDYVSPVPHDAIFSLAIFNGNTAHRGNSAILLTADEYATGDNVLIMNSVERPPVIDGFDDQNDVWDNNLTEIDIKRNANADNFIRSAEMGAAYDEDYIYFLIRWTEQENDDPPFDVSLSGEHRTWRFNGESWARRSRAEDKVALFWLISGTVVDSTNWQAYGCEIACHADRPTGMFTGDDTTQIDAWVWGSVTSDPVGYAVDASVRYQGITVPNPDGFTIDMGSRTWIDNTTGDGLPAYQHKTGIDYDGSYPMFMWEVTGFDGDAAWQSGATIPGAVISYPSYSAADVVARGRYDDGTWTVEMVRVRDTKNPDDIAF
jgi:hypothetical protein